MARDNDFGGSIEEGSKLSFGLIATGIVAAVLLIFIFQNTGKTEVTWLFFDTTPPLWLALLVAAVAGALLSELAGFFLRRRGNDD